MGDDPPPITDVPVIFAVLKVMLPTVTCAAALGTIPAASSNSTRNRTSEIRMVPSPCRFIEIGQLRGSAWHLLSVVWHIRGMIFRLGWGAVVDWSFRRHAEIV